MTRLPKEWVAWLALAAGLLSASGCGDARPGSTRGDPPREREPSTAQVVLNRNDQVQPLAPPEAFSAPSRLLPLAPAPTSDTAELQASPVLAQYALPEAASLPDLPTGPIWDLPSPPRAGADDLRSPAPQPARPSAAATQPPGVYAPQPQPPAVAAQPAHSPDAMQPVAEQAAAMSRRAYTMAQKGMLFAAKNELVQSLGLVAQALDVQQATGTHAAALAAGLTALAEADDFSPQSGRDAALDVAVVARGHRTLILRESRELSPVVAQQQYFSFAQQQLAFSVGGVPAASHTLFTLGKIQMALAGQAAQSQSLHGPRAMVFYQAALSVDSHNYLAANELGVLLARYGQLHDARRALLHSVSTRPHVEGWHNLAIVHERLGEAELARLAENERQLLAGQPAAAKTSAEKLIEWVDPQTFAAHGGREPGWPQPTAAKKPTNQVRR